MSNQRIEASQPIYNVIREENVMVEVRDGVKIAVDVYRPDAEGKFPGLLAMSPYGKISQVYPETPPQPFGKSIFEASCESGDPFYFAKRGYVFVIADHRGTGDSEGAMIGVMDAKEGEDGHDVVEWMARQPWCTGKIGTAGICYFSNTQLQIAITQPPHLTCIAPWEIFGDDLYNHGMYDGGVLSLFWYGLYTGTYPARCGYAIKNVKSWMIENTPPEELRRLVDEACADPRLRAYPYLYHLLKYPEKNPILFDLMLNPLDGPFYRERSFGEKLDRVQVPAYVGGPCFSFFGLPQIYVWNKLKVPKKLRLYTEMGYRPWKGDHDELLRWYDYWLKGLETGIMDEPDVRYFTDGIEKWHTASEFPCENTQYVNFYFNSLGRLMTTPEMDNNYPDSFVQEPLTVSEKRNRVTYLSAPLPEDLKVVGGAQVKFYASIDYTNTTWRVQLREHGSRQMAPLGSGWLRAAHRAIDEERTTKFEVVHDHTKDVPVVPGEICEYVVQLRPCAHIFRAGTQIELEISSIDIPTDPDTYDIMWHLCECETICHRIYRDAEHQSCIRLPVVPD